MLHSLVSWWNIIASANLPDKNGNEQLVWKIWGCEKSTGKSRATDNTNAICLPHHPAVRLAPGCGQETPYWPLRTGGSLAEPPGCGHMVSDRLILPSQSFVLLLTWHSVGFWDRFWSFSSRPFTSRIDVLPLIGFHQTEYKDECAKG